MAPAKAQLTLVLLLLASLFSLNAQAYDVDTHFYGTYAMARFAGLNKDVAAKLAVSAQWMDESYLSDPTSMILMPVTGVEKRRLLHFPASRVVGALAGSIRDESYGIKEPSGVVRFIVDEALRMIDFKGDLRVLAVDEQTEPNHEFASSLIMQGLKQGNLMKCGAGLHTLEDSYAHAGTAAITGHMDLWHWPDRPFADLAKYREMTGTVFRALVAIRAQMPREMLDCSQRNYGSKPTCEMTAQQLHFIYSNHPAVIAAAKYNILKDASYIRFALHDTLRRAIALNYFNSTYLSDGRSLEALLEEALNSKMLIGRSDSYGIFAEFLNKMITLQEHTGQKIINLDVIRDNMGLAADPNITTAEYIQSQYSPWLDALDGGDPLRGRLKFEQIVTLRLLSGYVPIPLSPTHRFERENDEAVTRHFEMKLRNENMQKLVALMFNENVEFVPNSTSTDDGFASEILQEPAAETKFERADPNITYITFSAVEKKLYDDMIFEYLFPHLNDKSLVRLVTALRKAKKAKSVDYVTAAASCVRAIYPILGPFVSDLYNEHLKPVGDEKFYQKAEQFERYKARHYPMFPNFFGRHDYWKRPATEPMALAIEPGQGFR